MKEWKFDLWGWVKALSTLAIVGITCFKIFETPIQLTVDFPTLLSLLLALFSVGLAALFYFKATETSNTFYDNTYNFTKDIAQLLVKMESGFGEKLRHLDEGYSSMREYLQNNQQSTSNEELEKTKKKIETEKQEIEKVLSERNEIIQNLVERSHLQAEEKEGVLANLLEKEKELEEARKELTRMNRRLLVDRMTRRQLREGDIDAGMAEFTSRHVIPKIGGERIMQGPSTVIRRSFDRLKNEVPVEYLFDLEKHGFYKDGLTAEGVVFLRELTKKEKE